MALDPRTITDTATIKQDVSVAGVVKFNIDPTGLAASATTDTTNAANISSGTLPLARLSLFTSGANGIAPASGGGTANFLRADGSWATPASGGGGLTIGTTAITSGTTGRVLFDNGGVVGEIAVTGSGSAVLATSPSLVTPTLGAATATTINKVALTAPATGSTLTIADGKTLTASNTLTLAGTDGSTLNVGAGGTLAASATTDTTNAANISNGTLNTARLPAPTATTIGGVKSLAAVTHQFLTQIGTDGSVSQAQPAASDVSGLAASATTDTTNATNIASGTLNAARLPATAVQTNVADQTIAGGANVTTLSLTTGNITVDCGSRPLQWIANTAAFTITAPASDGSCVVDVENGVGAGAITFSGFVKQGGDALDTTNGHNFRLYIVRNRGRSTVTVQQEF